MKAVKMGTDIILDLKNSCTYINSSLHLEDGTELKNVIKKDIDRTLCDWDNIELKYTMCTFQSSEGDVYGTSCTVNAILTELILRMNLGVCNSNSYVRIIDELMKSIHGN